MKRGVVTLLPNELKLAQASLPPDHSAQVKLNLGSGADTIQLELNAEEIESILDSLPAPDPNQPETITLRQKLTPILHPPQ